MTSAAEGATTGEQGAPPGAPVSVASGTAWGLAADVVTVVSGLALSVLIARYLGPTNRGVYFLVVLVATLAALAGDLGLSTSGLVFAAKRTLSLSHLHGGSVLASLGIAAVLAVAVLALGSWLIDSVLKGVSHGQLWLAVAATAPLLYAQVTGSILTGLGRIPSLSVIRIATGVATPLITLAILWATGGDTTWALLAWLITIVLLAVAIGVEGVRQLGWPRAPGPAEWHRMFGFGLRAHIGTLSHHGFLRIDVLFVSARSGPRNVGLYSLASLLAERIAIVGSAVYAAGASHVGSRERDAASELTARMVRIVLLVLVPAAAILAAVAHPLITIVFGSDFAPAVTPFTAVAARDCEPHAVVGREPVHRGGIGAAGNNDRDPAQRAAGGAARVLLRRPLGSHDGRRAGLECRLHGGADRGPSRVPAQRELRRPRLDPRPRGRRDASRAHRGGATPSPGSAPCLSTTVR